MRDFKLEEAQAGAAVCTRDGRAARIISWDAIIPNYPIIALVTDADGLEQINTFTAQGAYEKGHRHDFDLMMVPIKREGWARMCPDDDGPGYFSQIFFNKEDAEAACIAKNHDFVAHIEWEE